MTTTHPQWDIVSSVGLTALAVAAGRAIETSRDDNLISDEFAAPFTRAATPPQAMPTTDAEVAADDYVWGVMSGFMGVRTKFLDDFLAAAGTRQVVILAAGLDARAYRLDWSAGCRVFEVDQPKVLEFKQQVLDDLGARPKCERTVVPTDLRDDWASALQQAGFDPQQPAAWLAEGLLPYLPARAEEDLFDQVHKLSAVGSQVAIEKPGPRSFEEMRNHPMMHQASERFGIDMMDLWHTEPRRDCADWLSWAGWETSETAIAELQDRYQRDLGEEARNLMGRNVMVTARRTS